MTNNQRNAVSAAAGLLLAGLVLLIPAPAAHADKAGMDLVRNVIAKYRGLQTYSDSWTTEDRQGTRLQRTGGDTRLARPNRFFFSSENNGTPFLVLSGNGTTNTAYLALRRQYAQQPATPALPAMLQGVDHLGVRLFAGLDLAGDLKDATIVGSGQVSGTPVRVVRVTFKLEPPKGQTLSAQEKARLEQLRANQPDIRYHVGTTDLLIRRIEMTTRGKTAAGKQIQVTVRQDFRNVRVNQPIPTTAFVFTPPPGTTRFTPPKNG